jgi:hypothetical protein
MIKIDNSTRVRTKSYTSPAIVVELDLEVRANTSAPLDPRFNPRGDGLPPADPDTLPSGG